MIVVPYKPRPYQTAIHTDGARFKVIVAHRRAGKTVALVNHGIRGVLTCERERPRVAYVAPTYRMAKRIAWDYAKHYSQAVPGVKFNASELRIDYPNGGRLLLLGADGIDDLRGIYLDGAVLDEYAMFSPRVFPEIILPALMDRGGWAILAGTPLGANQLKRAYVAARDGVTEDGKPLVGWRAFMLRASETGAISDEQLQIARANMSEAEYAQEFECSFDAVIKGAYYGREMERADLEQRITDVPYNPALGVTVAVDLGMRDAFACWFLQEHHTGGQVRAIDYRSFTGKGLPQVKQAIDQLGYTITRWVAPHDIAVRELGTGRSRIEIARELGMDFDIANQMSLQDGIEATRSILPLMVFDRRKCSEGIDALRQYRAEWDEDAQIFSKQPVHDWTSHPADALRTYATSRTHGLRTNWQESLRDIGLRKAETSRRARAQRARAM